jgi:hypothetical protein
MATLAGLLRLTPRARKPWSDPSRLIPTLRPYERIAMELEADDDDPTTTN